MINNHEKNNVREEQPLTATHGAYRALPFKAPMAKGLKGGGRYCNPVGAVKRNFGDFAGILEFKDA